MQEHVNGIATMTKGATAPKYPSFPALQRNAYIPLYVQIRDRLVADIEADRLPVGSRLASEPEFVAQLGVGRPTVRQALSLLRQEGWITTRRGSGSFVTRPRQSISLMDFDGLTRALHARGFAVRDEVLHAETTHRVDLEVLSLEEEGPWWTVARLRRIDVGAGVEPLCVEVDAFYLALSPDAQDQFARSGSAAGVLGAGYGHAIGSCEVATRAVAATSKLAKLLGLRKGAPVLAMERINRGIDGSVVHVVTYRLRTDRFPVVEALFNPATRG